MSRSKQIGTAAETLVVNCLRAAGFIHAERRALRGVNDQGDVTGIPGVVIEVKAEKAMTLASYMDETEAERKNNGADLAVCWHKRRGRGDPLDWYVSMSGAQFVELLQAHCGLEKP